MPKRCPDPPPRQRFGIGSVDRLAALPLDDRYRTHPKELRHDPVAFSQIARSWQRARRRQLRRGKRRFRTRRRRNLPFTVGCATFAGAASKRAPPAPFETWTRKRTASALRSSTRSAASLGFREVAACAWMRAPTRRSRPTRRGGPLWIRPAATVAASASTAAPRTRTGRLPAARNAASTLRGAPDGRAQ